MFTKLLFILILVTSLIPYSLLSDIWRVTNGQLINESLQIAAPGDTIIVEKGEYKEKLIIEPPLFNVLRDALEDYLLNNRMLLIQTGTVSWENPQVKLFTIPNQGKIDDDTLINSMQSLLDFMKANNGFKTA